MKLECLGSGGFIPTDKTQTACYLLPKVGVMLDAGSGAYRLPDFLKTPTLDVYLSHGGHDHTCGIGCLFPSYLKWHHETSGLPMNADTMEQLHSLAHESVKQTRIFGDAATLKAARKTAPDLDFQWCELDDKGSLPLPEEGTLTHFVMERGTVGYRLDWPKHSLAYITDTLVSPKASYLKHIKGVDVLLLDCHGSDAVATLMERTGHGNPAAAAKVAAKAQVKRLVLVHNTPFKEHDYRGDLASARKVFSPIDVAYDGVRIKF